MSSPLNLIYATTDEQEAAELACQEHPEWRVDADGTNFPDLIKAAVEHLREDHRKHVNGCMCRDWVTDQRCLPRIDWAEVAR